MTDKTEKYQRIFNDVLSLYLVIREAQEERGLPLRRAAVRSNGEVAAESIDFLCDVELKAKRVLPSIQFEMFKQGLELPLHSQIDLGETFLKCKLGMTGDYKALYFHIRQVQDGQALQATELSSAEGPTPSLEDYDRKPL